MIPAMKTVVALNQEYMGHGDTSLGRRILKTFLQKAISVQDLDAVVFYNGGVKLVTADSPVLAELTMLEEHGVDLLPCATCLQHFGMQPAVSSATPMDDIVAAMSKATKVITI
jgi:intracellular sulfur oxidation DsrE/DsrF family protein